MSEQLPSSPDSIRLFGLDFSLGTYVQVRDRLFNGAFMVVPSAPSLVILDQNPDYRQAMLGSDFAIPDSGMMVLLLRLLKGVRVNKFSGLTFLRMFLQEEVLKNRDSLFLVEPSEGERAANQAYLQSLGIPMADSCQYVAPMYGNGMIQDTELLAQLHAIRPRFIVINLGGGVQERLGYTLRQNLNYRPTIICTGAAIAFLTGHQASISPLIDRIYLGWLARCLWRPKVYIPKYFSGLKLIPMIWKADVRMIKEKEN